MSSKFMPCSNEKKKRKVFVVQNTPLKNKSKNTEEK